MTEQGSSSDKGKGQGKGASQVQAETASQEATKKEEELTMGLLLRLPQELILEILKIVVADCSVTSHNQCFDRCLNSSFARKLALKKTYETSTMHWTFWKAENELGCPIWGVGHLEKVDLRIELRHCQCTLGSALHTKLNKPSRVTVGQLTLIDEGVYRYRVKNFAAKIVIKDFGYAKHLKIKKEDDNVDYKDEVKVCYHHKQLREAFKNACGTVVHCKGLFDEWTDYAIKDYCETDIGADRACENCAESSSVSTCRCNDCMQIDMW